MARQDDHSGAPAGEAGRSSATSGHASRVVLTGALVRTLDDAVGDLAGGDVLVEDGVVTAVGHDLVAAVGRGARVVDCAGSTLVPAAGPASRRVGALTPGSPATFGVLPTRAARPGPLEEVVWCADEATLWVDGAPTRPGGGRGRTDRGAAARLARSVESPLVGAWYDDRADVLQELGADGRYDETRGGRRHAYQGSYWVQGDRVVYRDDLGFWAYATLRGATLHHAHFRFHRRA
ncbi:Atu4866 domain-containing protein [Cellulomonas endometrii]|uniref:Atu4866 domain-containing protein n=1 Tax=Cellulomonas endometrii TaxID=3036301 RepID=UPI0024AE74AE|nr:Atu4866 domain-containing protein [Cellulomonas endometrii]